MSGDREPGGPYFKASRPASTLIEISRFAIDGMLIEIDAIAAAR